MASTDWSKGYPRVRWRLKGSTGKQRTLKAPDETTAKLWEAEATQAELKGEDWVPPSERKPEGHDSILIDLATKYLKELSRTARPSTIDTYSYNLDRFLAFLPGGPDDCRLRDFTADAVRAYDAQNLAEGRSVATRRTRVAPVKTFSKWLALQFDDFRPARIEAVKMPRQPKPVVLALSWEEVDAVIARLGPKASIAGMIQRCAGVRRGVAIGLTWADVLDLDTSKPQFNIPDEITKGGLSGRIIPISPVLARFLLEHRNRLPNLKPRDRIAAIGKESYSVMFKRALRAAVAAREVREAALTVRSSTHLARKAFSTNLRRAKADADAVEYLIGHDIGIKAHYIDLHDLCFEAVQLVPEVGSTPEPEKVSEPNAEPEVASNVVSFADFKRGA